MINQVTPGSLLSLLYSVFEYLKRKKRSTHRQNFLIKNQHQ